MAALFLLFTPGPDVLKLQKAVKAVEGPKMINTLFCVPAAQRVAQAMLDGRVPTPPDSAGELSFVIGGSFVAAADFDKLCGQPLETWQGVVGSSDAGTRGEPLGSTTKIVVQFPMGWIAHVKGNLLPMSKGTKRVSMSDDSAAPTVAPSMAPSVMGRLGGESKQKLKVFIVTTVPRSDEDGTMQLSTEGKFPELFFSMYGFLIDMLPDIGPKEAKKEVNHLAGNLKAGEKHGATIIMEGNIKLSKQEVYNKYWQPLAALPKMDGKLQLTGDHLKYYTIYTKAVAAAQLSLKSEMTDGLEGSVASPAKGLGAGEGEDEMDLEVEAAAQAAADRAKATAAAKKLKGVSKDDGNDGGEGGSGPGRGGSGGRRGGRGGRGGRGRGGRSG